MEVTKWTLLQELVKRRTLLPVPFKAIERVIRDDDFSFIAMLRAKPSSIFRIPCSIGTTQKSFVKLVASWQRSRACWILAFP
jgi:hypothetical protein